jgi:predicted patatin/cPLA2 family phospholipase
MRKHAIPTLIALLSLIIADGAFNRLYPNDMVARTTPHARVNVSPNPPRQGDASKNPAQENPARSFTAQEAASATIPGFPGVRFFADSEAAFTRALPAKPPNDEWLALSAGGADGAFGAGILNGWSAAGTRPNFAVVTGVSTGALLAPYAFLGSRYDEQLRTAFTTTTDADIFENGQTATSLLDTWPLRDLLARLITPKLVADVADEYQRGRRLFVVTSNLDLGRSVVWDMGAIAVHRDEAALRLFRNVLLASASLPGIFPPVFIDVESNGHRFQEMHADGGIGGPFFVAPESWMTSTSQIHLPARKLYVIINGRLAPEFDVTAMNALAILGRAFSAAVKTGARVEVADVFSAAQRDSIAFKLAHIGRDFEHTSHGAFDPDYMRALFEFGFQEARNGQAFRDTPPIQLSLKSTQ